jgi:hypothetical protein
MARVDRHWAIAALLAACVALHAPSGLAVSDAERAGARAQAVAGAQAFEKGQWQEALDRFTRAESIVHSPTHVLFIGKAQLQLGQLVQAHESLLKVVNEKADPGASAAFVDAQKDAQKEAQSLLDQLGPRIPQLRIVLQGAPAGGTQVTMDGEPVPAALVDVPHPVNPGQHSIKVTANGLAGEATIAIAEGQTQTATIQLTPQAGASAGGAVSVAPETVSPAQDTGGAAPSDPKKTYRLVSYVGFGVGLIGLGVGTVFALQHGSKVSDADALNDRCRPAGCTPQDRQAIGSLDDEANSAGTIATVGLVAGGVGVATGVTFLILSLGGNSAQATATASGRHVQPYIGANRIGVMGTF